MSSSRNNYPLESRVTRDKPGISAPIEELLEALNKFITASKWFSLMPAGSKRPIWAANEPNTGLFRCLWNQERALQLTSSWDFLMSAIRTDCVKTLFWKTWWGCFSDFLIFPLAMWRSLINIWENFQPWCSAVPSAQKIYEFSHSLRMKRSSALQHADFLSGYPLFSA